MYIYTCFLVCPAGSFLNAEAGSSCEVCAKDTYSESVDSTSCTPCAVGDSTYGQTGATDCSEYIEISP